MLAKHLWMPWVWVLVVVAVAAAFVFSSPVFQICVDQETYQKDSQQPEKSPSGFTGVRLSQGAAAFWFCTGTFIDENAAGITAVASLIVAGFTLTLWWASRGQLRQLERTVDSTIRAER